MATMKRRNLSPLDTLLSDLQHGLDALRPAATRDNYPAQSDSDTLDNKDSRHAAGLMRVNHAGEVAAQALYRGQARVARNPDTREHLLHAAEEEQDHLDWCAKRLEELGSEPSQMSPLWYAGAYAIGAAAGLAGDRWSLGFVSETERQVEEHLQGHLKTLPDGDKRSREIVEQMKQDEARHGAEAREAGGRELPPPLRGLMRAAAKIMTTAAYRG
ncbi:MAG: 2-polyprenyl-3-methyl-6-methoxy-1,4-benzoquinone monooxygenase [Oceanococcus sp.]